jgi:hypothetical protein
MTPALMRWAVYTWGSTSIHARKCGTKAITRRPTLQIRSVTSLKFIVPQIIMLTLRLRKHMHGIHLIYAYHSWRRIAMYPSPILGITSHTRTQFQKVLRSLVFKPDKLTHHCLCEQRHPFDCQLPSSRAFGYFKSLRSKARRR